MKGYEAVASVESMGPGIDVARAMRRALAAAHRKAAEVGLVVLTGGVGATDTVIGGVPGAIVARGLGRFAAGVPIVESASVEDALRRTGARCVLEVAFTEDGRASVTTYSRRAGMQ
jgi:hypothetical protein